MDSTHAMYRRMSGVWLEGVQ